MSEVKIAEPVVETPVDSQAKLKDIKPKPGVTVVTPENFEDYVREQGVIGKGIETPAEESTDESDEKPTETKDDENPSTEPKKKKNGFNERISELTQKRKEAEERAERLANETKTERESRIKAEQEVLALRLKYEPPKSEELGPEPTVDQFKDVVEFTKAIKDWTAEKTLKDQRDKALKEAAENHAKKVMENWNKNETAVKTELSDYEETVKNAHTLISDELRDAILESDIGPKLRYHLAKNPDVTEKLLSLTVPKMLKEIGKLEVELGGAVKPPIKSAVSEVSKAPAPITPLKGIASVPSNKIDSDGNFSGTYEEWKKLRREGKIR